MLAQWGPIIMPTAVPSTTSLTYNLKDGQHVDYLFPERQTGKKQISTFSFTKSDIILNYVKRIVSETVRIKMYNGTYRNHETSQDDVSQRRPGNLRKDDGTNEQMAREKRADKTDLQ